VRRGFGGRAGLGALVAVLTWAGLALVVAPAARAAATLSVPSQYATISAAMAAAVDGDTIQVAPGAYQESVDFAGKDVDLVSTAGPSGTTITPDYPGQIRLGPGGSVQGFTFHGARNNEAIRVEGDGALVRGNRFSANDGPYAGSGAVITSDWSVTVDRNWFTTTSCGGDQQHYASTVRVSGPASVVTNNVFLNNSCHVALLLGIPPGSTAVVANNTIIGSPIGMKLWQNGVATATIRNNIVVGNGTGILNYEVDAPTIDHNLVHGNGQDYVGVADQTGINGNISADPLFFDPANRDFRLLPGSPAVDTGSALGAPAVDKDGRPRPVDGADADAVAEFDMGAYERQGNEVALPSTAQTFHVPGDLPTIAAAVSAASDYDTIEVAPGTYPEVINLQRKDVQLVATGGPAVTTIDPPPLTTHQIGPGGGLVGFTVTGGAPQYGAPLYVVGDGRIQDNVFVANTGGIGGASAIEVRGAPTIEGNQFLGNTCGSGSFNRAVITISQGKAKVRNNVLLDEPRESGIAFEYGDGGQVVNNTVVGSDNALRLDMTTGASTELLVRNNLLVDNQRAVWVPRGGPIAFDHNLLSGNSVDYSGVGDRTGVAGNLRAPALLLDRLGGDVRLQQGSPAVDAANPDGAPTDDVAGDPRPVDGADADTTAEFDIGAYERQGDEPAPTVQNGILQRDWSGDGLADIGSRYDITTAPAAASGLYTALYKQTDGNGPMRVSKYTAQGAPAGGWGTSGYVLRRFAPTAGISFPVEVQVSGLREVVTGYFSSASSERIGVARLRSDGSYDPAFSSDGRALYKVFTYEHDYLLPFRTFILNGGKIAMGVAAFDYDSRGQLRYTGQAAMRLNNDGTLDKTFAGDGTLSLPADIGDIQFLPDGRSYMDRAAGNVHEVRRLRANGTLDPTFSGDGKAVINCFGPHGSILKPDALGRPTAMCIREVSSVIQLTMARWTTSGAIDTTFAGGGKTTVALPGMQPDDYAVKFGPDARAYVVGRSTVGPDVLSTWRITANGVLDTTYSHDGTSTVALPFVIDPYQITPSGDRIYVVGMKSSVLQTVVAIAG
jgi:uncharacterized delta-60 repeat protein